MKLHLPSGLRKALLACLAALAMPAFTVSSGAALFGGVAFSILTAQHAAAQASDPLPDAAIADDDEDEDEGIMPLDLDSGVSYTEGTYTAGMDITDNIVLVLANGTSPSFGTTSADANLKLVINGGGNGALSSALTLNSLWVSGETGAGRLQINTSEYISNVRNIYVDKSAIWLRGNNLTLETNFYLGTCMWTGDGESNFHNAALRSSIDITTSGSLTLMEDAGIVVQGNKTITFNGRTNGSGYVLSFDNYGAAALHLFGGGVLGGLNINPVKTSGLSSRAVSTVELSGTFTLDAATTVGDKGKLILGRECDMTLTGSITVNEGGLFTSNGQLMMRSGSSLSLATAIAGSSHSIASLHATGGTIDLSTDLTLSALSLSGSALSLNLGYGKHILNLATLTASEGGMLTITLTGWDAVENNIYDLFSYASDNDFDVAWWDYIRVTVDGLGEGLGVKYLDGGRILIVSTAEHESFEWENETSENGMQWGKNNWNGSEGYQNAGEEDVAFSSSTTAEVTLTGDDEVVRANSMSVNGAGYTFSGAGHSLEVKNLLLDIESATPNATVQFNVDATVSGSLTGGGDIFVANGATLTLSGMNAEAGNIGITLTEGASLWLSEGTVLRGLTFWENEQSVVTLGGSISLSSLTWQSGSHVTFNREAVSSFSARAVAEDTVWVELGDGVSSAKLADMTFGEGVGLKKSGSGTTTLLVDGATSIDMPIMVAGGTLEIDGASSDRIDINGELVLTAGSLVFNSHAGGARYTFTSAVTIDSNLTTNSDIIILRQGGTLNGTLLANWSGQVHLGADLLMGANANLSKGGVGTNRVKRAEGAGDVFILFTNIDNWAKSDAYDGLTTVTAETFDGKVSSDFVETSVGIGITNGIQLGINGGGEISRSIKIDAGSKLAFTRAASATVHGKIVGDGVLEVATEADNNNDYCLTIEQGGSIGELRFNGWGAGLVIGADFIVGSFKAESVPNTTYNRKYFVGSSAASGANFIVDMADGSVTAKKVEFREGITLVKRGGGTQIFDTSNVAGTVRVEDGTLRFNGDSTIARVEGSGGILWLEGGNKTVGVFDFDGTVKAFNDALQLNLTNGGRIGTLINGWGGTINLGANLVIENVGNESHNGTFRAMEGRTASLVFDTTYRNIDVHGYNWTFDGIGLGVKGGNTLTMKGATFTTIDVTGGSTLVLNAALTASTSLSISESSRIEVGANTLTINGSLTASGSSTFAVSNGGYISGLTGLTVTDDEKLNIVLSGFSLSDFTGNGYALFREGSFSEAWWASINLDFGFQGTELYDIVYSGGTITLREKVFDSLYWASNADGTWDGSGNDWSGTENGTGSQVYDATKKAIFGTTSAQQTVTLGGAITSAGVEVKGDYLFRMGSNTLTIQGGGLTLGSGARLELDGSTTTVESLLMLGGDATLMLSNEAVLSARGVSLNSHTLTLGGNGTMRLDGTDLLLDSGTLKTVKGGSDTVTIDGRVVISNGATLQVDGTNLIIGSFESNGGDGSGGGLRIFGANNNERTLTVQDVSRLNGNLHVAWSGALELRADLIVGNGATFSTDTSNTNGSASSIRGGEGVYILFATGTSTQVGSVLESWLTAGSNEKFGVFSNIDDAIGYGFTGGGTINLKVANDTSTNGSATLTRAFKVDTDTTVVIFDGSWDMQSFAGEGTIIIQSARQGGNGVANKVTLHEGGSIGTLGFNTWGGWLDIEGSLLTINALSANNDLYGNQTGRVHQIDGDGGRLVIDIEGEALAKHMIFGEGLTIIKRGEGTQNLTDTTLDADLEIEEGTINFTDGTSGAGVVTVSGGSASFVGDASLGGLKATSGSASFNGSTTINGNVTVNGGSVDFVGATNVTGTVTVQSDTLTWEHRGGNHHDFSGWQTAIEDFVHFGALDIQISGEYQIKRNLSLGSLTWGEGVTSIWIHDPETDANGNKMHPFISVDNALEAADSRTQLSVMNAVLLLKQGGIIGGNLVTGWDGGLILGADLEVCGNYSRDSGQAATFRSYDDEQHYLALRNATDTVREQAFGQLTGTTWNRIGVKKTGSGEIKFTGGGTLNTFVNVAEGTLTLAGNTTVNGAFTLGATLKMESGVTLSVQSLTLESGAVLALSSLDASSAVITLSGDSAALSGSLVLDLTGWTTLESLLNSGTTSFGLFSNFSSYEDLRLSLRGVALAGWTYEVDENGNLVFSQQDSTDTLYWVSTDGEWSANESLDWAGTADGSPAFAYSADKNVVFGENGEREAITVSGELSVLSATVSGHYAFNMSGDTSLSIGEGGLTIDAGATLELSSSGTLSIDGDVNLDGTLMLNIANSGAGTTPWDAANNIVAGDDALIVLNFANGNASRTSINTFIGTAYTGAVELRGGSLFGTDAATPTYSSITVKEGAQLALGADYGGEVHISGFGATVMTGGDGQQGALRLDRWVGNNGVSYTFSGDLYLDAVASVSSYEGNTTGEISATIHGGNNVLFVFGAQSAKNSKVTLSGEITALAGLWSKAINLGSNANTIGANVEVTGDLSIVAVAEGYGEGVSRFGTELTGVEGSFVFGVENAGRTMTLTSTSSLSGTANIVKVGAGKLVLEGSVADYSGALTIEAGTVEVKSADSATIANTTVVGGTLSIGEDVERLSGNVTLSKGTAESATAGSLSWAASTLSIGGTLTVAQRGELTVADGKTLNVGTLSSLGSLEVAQGGTLSADQGNISGSLTLNGELSLGAITNRGDGLLLSASSVTFGANASLTLTLTGLGNGNYKLFNFEGDTCATWDESWKSIVSFVGLEEGTWSFEDGWLRIEGVLDNILLDNGENHELDADADGNGGALGRISVSNTEGLEEHNSVVNVVSGEWTVRAIEVAEGATLTLDGAADRGDTWTGGTLSLAENGTITNNGTLVIKGVATGDSAWNTVFGENAALPTVTGSGDLVLDFVTSTDTLYRVSLRDVIGNDYTGKVVLQRGVFKGSEQNSSSTTPGGLPYELLTVKDGAQFFLDGVSYNGELHIAGSGYDITGGHGQDGALRLRGASLRGTLVLDDDARIAVYNGVVEDQAILNGTTVVGNGHSLYKRDGGVLTINGAQVSGLAGLHVEASIGDNSPANNKGGSIVIKGNTVFTLGEAFTFGVNEDTSISLNADASIVSATTGEGDEIAAIPGAISKTGAGTLNLNGSLSGFTGTLEIEAGTVNLNNSDTETVFTEVILSGGTLALTKETVNIGGLGGESGSITATEARTLVLNTAEDHATAVALNAAEDDGTAYITLTKQGEGKQTFSAEVTLAALNMEGGTLALTGGGSTGNITFSGTSTLKLGAEDVLTGVLSSAAGAEFTLTGTGEGALVVGSRSDTALSLAGLTIGDGGILRLDFSSAWQTMRIAELDVEDTGQLQVKSGELDFQATTANIRNGGLTSVADEAGAYHGKITMSGQTGSTSTLNFDAATEANAEEWSDINDLDFRSGEINVAGNLKLHTKGVHGGNGDYETSITVQNGGKLQLLNSEEANWTHGTLAVEAGGSVLVANTATQTLSALEVAGTVSVSSGSLSATSLTFTGAGTVQVSGTEDADGTLSVTNAVSIADGASIILSEHGVFSAGGLTIQSGGSLIMDGGSYNPAGVTLQDGGMVKIVRGKTWTVSSLPWEVTADNLLAINPLDGTTTDELATLEWIGNGGGSQPAPQSGSVFGEGLNLKINYSADKVSSLGKWMEATDLTVQGSLELASGELCLHGNSTLATVTGGTNGFGWLTVMSDGEVSITGDSSINNRLDMRGTLHLLADLTVRGLTTNGNTASGYSIDSVSDGGQVAGADLTIDFNAGEYHNSTEAGMGNNADAKVIDGDSSWTNDNTFTFGGTINISGKLTKQGSGTQVLGGDVTAGDGVDVVGGTLSMGSGTTITGTVTVGHVSDADGTVTSSGRLTWGDSLTITGDLVVAGGSIFGHELFEGIESTEAEQRVLLIPGGLTIEGGLMFVAFHDDDWTYSHKVQIDGNFALGATTDGIGVNVSNGLTLILSGTSEHTQTIAGEVTGGGQLYLRGMGGNGAEETLTVDLQSGGTLTGALVAGKTTLLIGDTLTVGGLRAESMGETFSQRDLTVGASGNATGTPDFTLNVTEAYGEGGATVFHGSLTLNDGVRLVKSGAGTQVIGSTVDSLTGAVGTADMTLTAGNIAVQDGMLRVASGALVSGAVTIDEGATLSFWSASGAERTITGTVTGDGTLEVSHQLVTLQSGATVGNLSIGNGSSLALGANLTTGGIAWLGGDATEFSATGDAVTLTVTGTAYPDATSQSAASIRLNDGVRFELAAGVNQQVAASSFADRVTLGAGATLQTQGSEFSGEVQLGAGATLVAVSGTANTVSGTVTMGADSALTVKSGAELTLSGKLYNAGASGRGIINAMGGKLTITGTAEETAFGGVFNFSGGEVELDRDLTVSDITISGVNSTLNGSGTLTIDTNTDNTLSTTAGRLTVEDVRLVKKGSSVYEIAGLHSSGAVEVQNGQLVLSGSEVTTGDLTLADRTRIQFARGGESGYSAAVNGELSGSGDIVVAAGTLNIGGAEVTGESFSGRVSLRNNARLNLERDVTIGGLSTLLDSADTVSGTLQEITGAGHTLTLNIAEGKTEEQTLAIQAAEGVTLHKTGKGTQSVLDLGADKVLVTEGTLSLAAYSGTPVHEFSRAINDLTVQGEGSVLEVQRRSWNSVSTNITLAEGGTMIVPAEPVSGMAHSVRLGSMTVTGEGNRFKWGENVEVGDTVAGQVDVVFGELTGDGSLVVDSFGNAALDTSSRRRHLVFNNVNNFDGMLSVDEVVGPNSYVAIGHVNQAAGIEGEIHVGGSGLYTYDFRKEGEGSLTINELTAIHESEDRCDLWMDYTGELAVGTLHVMDKVVLHYTTGDENSQLEWAVAELQGLENGVGIELSEVLSSRGGADKLRTKGICLGITGVDDYTDMDELMDKLTLYVDGLEASPDTKWGLEAREGKLWLVVSDFVADTEVGWDSAWSMGNGLRYAPGEDTMNAATIRPEDVTRIDSRFGSFSDCALSLVAAGDYYKTGRGQRIVLLTTGGTNYSTKASVVGGLVQVTDGAALEMTKADTYILLAPGEGTADEAVRFHLLVGGSSCVSTGDDGTVGGFTGNTHIQMEGGTVDYIVGGNHVTNRAFAFEGNSFISVMSGDVRGGIVGGSTLTSGSPDSMLDVVEFSGSSYIFIYTALHGSEAPAINAGPGVEGSSFAAVVGGNAWIGLPAGAQNMAPAFRGNSHITINLQDSPAESFEKDIVGGNYTTFTREGAENASTTFEGDAEIVINASDAVSFKGSIVGASRRASAGEGSTEFLGNTSVTLNGGSYEQAVVGGLYFDDSATGDHTAEITGNTSVTVNGGNLWRVTGGSYSLAGADGAKIATTGGSSVSISGGSFASQGAEQEELGFVAGGDFYRSTSGTEHKRTGDTSVSISGGSFEGVHIAGGDYVNFSDVASAMTIDGTSSVSIEGEVGITGLVIGGTYLTDNGAGGSVTTKSTSVSIGEGAELSAKDGHADHQSVAVVAGHVVIDNGNATGGHTATVGETSVSITGGSISGHVVGGSYVSDATGGVNTLHTDSVSISLTGGSVTGDIIGGHYSENTTTPDTLELGSVSIALAGGTVTGDIIGGSFRAATAPAGGTAPKQGEITISLKGGELQGNVYAAGRHVGEAALTATTQNVTVSVGSGVTLTAGKTISGGYDKSTADRSTVGTALLSFADAAYTNLDGVNWANFDTVDTAQDVTLTGSFKATSNKAFTKTGAGTLTLAKGLSGYAGRIQVNDGILALGAPQTITSLGFDLSTRVGRNSAETAYLQAIPGGKLTPVGGKVAVSITHDGENKLRAGLYYLTGELQGLGADPQVKNFFTWSDDELKKLGENTPSRLALDLLLVDNCLVLRIHNDSKEEWYWEGGAGAAGTVWRNDTATNWTREGSTLEKDSDADPALADVHFNAGAMREDVKIEGTVTPHDVLIESGSFTFTGADGGISIVGDGKLVVGTENTSDPAELTLELNNKRIPIVELNASGTLTLAAEKAINSNAAVSFNGGLLVLAEEGGKLLFEADLSKNASGEIRLQVGDASPELMTLAAAEDAVPVAQWGSGNAVDTNEGLKSALDERIEKSGRGTLVLSWTETKTAAEHSGEVEVLDGTLQMSVATTAADSTVTLSGDAMRVAAGAELQVAAKGGELQVARAFAGEGTGVIGSADAAGSGSYVLTEGAKGNEDFGGVIELLGNSSAASLVSVEDTATLGGAATTLRLSGRHIVLASNSAVLSAKAVQVTDQTVNYVGGTSLTPGNVNAAIELKGSVEGSGVLANAQGGFRHTLSGDVSAFTGTLVAGAKGVGSGAESRWTLTGSTAAIQANLAGDGLVEIAATGTDKVTLSGKVGDEKLGSSTDLRNNSAATLVLADNGRNISTGSLILTEGMGGIRIGVDKDTTGSWLGSVEGKGTLTLVSGSMSTVAKGGAAKEVILVADVADGATVRVNGTEGSRFSAITVNEGGHLNEVSGTITASAMGVADTTKVKLVIDTPNLGNAASSHAEDYMVGMLSGGQLRVADSAGFTVDVSNEALFDLLVRFRADDANLNRAYMHLVSNGTLSFADGVDIQETFEDNSNAGILKLLKGFHLAQEADSPGDLVLTGVSTNVYLVAGPDGAANPRSDARDVTAWNQLDGYVATVVDHDATLHINLSEHNADRGDTITVNNLVGLEDSVLRGTNSMADADPEHVITIELNNSILRDADIDDTGLSTVGGATKKDVRGLDTTFLGTIEGGDYVNFAKTGAGTLTVGSAKTGHGGVNIAGELELRGGALHVAGDRAGEGNEIAALVFDYAEAAPADSDRGLILSGGSTTVRGIEERGAYTADNLVHLGEDGEMHLISYDGLTLTSTRFEGEGTLTVDATPLTLDSEGSATERLNGVTVSVVNNSSLLLTGGTQMTGGALSVGDAAVTLSSATISGAAVSLAEGATLSLADKSSISTTESVELAEGSFTTVAGGSQLHADGGLALEGLLDLTDTTANTVTGLTGSGTLRGWVPADAKDSKAAALTVNGSAEQNVFSGTLDGAGKLTVSKGAGLTLKSVSRGDSAGGWDLTNLGTLEISILDGAKSSLRNLHMGSASTTTITLNTDEGERQGRLDLENLSWDSGAKLIVHNEGAKVLDRDYIDLGLLSGTMSAGALDVKLSGVTTMHYETGALYQRNGHWYVELVETTENRFVSDRMEKNARAGGEMIWEATKKESPNWRRICEDPLAIFRSDFFRLVNHLEGMDIETQEGEMSRINAAAAGSSTAVLGAALAQDLERQLRAIRNRTTSIETGSPTRTYNLWLNGESSYHKLSADGFAPGYSLSSWGGTVGMDVNLTSSVNVGLALSALYGDLKTDAADSARGDMDTTYATFFARVSRGPWMHTFLFSGGVADISLDRTVNYGSGSYSTKGSTDGFAVGALYELGYASIMNAEGTFLLQSVFNVEMRHVAINGYTETGSDAGLTVDDASYTTFTVGAGARMQSVVDSRLLNRSALVEARLLVKADVGDRSGKVKNDFINGYNSKRELESAEIGAVGIEFGAGVTVPVSKRGSVFVDGSVEVRSGYSSLDANVGYRVSF